MDFVAVNEQIALPDEDAKKRAVDVWNSIAKPIGSLGALEDIIVQVAGMTRSEDVAFPKRAVIAMCADNGVVAEGVTQSDQDVTALVATAMGRRASSVCKMAAVAGAQVFPVDVGIAGDVVIEGVEARKVMPGTANMTQGPAMSKEDAMAAIQVGIDMARKLVQDGYAILATGEMGIGNTTTSSAVASVLLDRPVTEMTGRGAGLSNAGLTRKIDAIERAIAKNEPDPDDALDVLAKVGGLDMAGMAGVFIGGALMHVPVVIDGFISAVSALVASRLCPNCKAYMLASHVSAEPAGRLMLDALGLQPVIQAGMRLGEGTGAVCLFPLLDLALSVYNGSSFDSIGVEAYDADLNNK